MSELAPEGWGRVGLLGWERFPVKDPNRAKDMRQMIYLEPEIWGEERLRAGAMSFWCFVREFRLVLKVTGKLVKGMIPYLQRACTPRE